ncbi:hypothetical protein AB0F76_02115, partial [Streptomyces aureus]
MSRMSRTIPAPSAVSSGRRPAGRTGALLLALVLTLAGGLLAAPLARAAAQTIVNGTQFKDTSGAAARASGAARSAPASVRSRARCRAPVRPAGRRP